MPTQATVVLFDIDGTLITCAGAGRRSMQRAFAELGASPAASEFDFGGMTDRAIARQGLLNAGLLSSDESRIEAQLDAFLDRYLDYLQEEVPLASGYRVLPGVVEMVDRLRGIASFAVGLGTGNIARGAKVKLSRGGLYDRFAFGGFGSDHEERPRLLSIGARRGAAALGAPLEECRVVVIGDTPRDVSAAAAIGAECIAVATGRHDEHSLRASGAQFVVRDLSQPEALIRVLGGLS